MAPIQVIYPLGYDVLNNLDHFIVGSLSVHGVNIALGKPSRQPHVQSGGVAGRAVDRNTDPDYLALSCSHTDGNHASGSHWWRVDLLGVYSIGMVQITNRGSSGACKYNLERWDNTT